MKGRISLQALRDTSRIGQPRVESDHSDALPGISGRKSSGGQHQCGIRSPTGYGLPPVEMDVGSTVVTLAELGVRVHCLALGGADLTSSTGKLTMNVLNAVAEFERDLLVERTQSGLSRAKAEGETLGRPLSLTEDQRRAVERRLNEGITVSALAREFNTNRQTTPTPARSSRRR